MNKIIQLSECEYNKLYEKASVNQIDIERLAQEMYETKGTFEIRMSIALSEDRRERISFYPSGYIVDYDGEGNKKYQIPYKEAKKIVDFTTRRMNEYFELVFGKQIHDVNLYTAKKRALRDWKLKFIGFTIFGWLAALALVLVTILK